jgi:hypothetical protein
MECPKCKHVIHINLTPEELVYCPYCNQRMIPPKELNLCPVCGAEMPLGAATCANCALKAEAAEHVSVEGKQDRHPSPAEERVETDYALKPIENASKPLSALAPEVPMAAEAEPVVETRAVEELPQAPAATPEPAPIPPELIKEKPVITPPAVLTPAPKAKEPAVQLPTIEEWPWELAVARESNASVAITRGKEPPVTPSQAETETPAIVEPPIQPQAVEELQTEPVIAPAPEPAAPLAEEPATAPPMPEILAVSFEDMAEVQAETTEVEQPVVEKPVTPVHEETPAVQIEKALFADEILRQLRSNTAPQIKLTPHAGLAEFLEASRAQPHAEKLPPDEFNFCNVCGRKLPPESLFCPRCGKSLQVEEGSPVPPETTRLASMRDANEPVVIQKKQPPVAMEPPRTPEQRPLMQAPSTAGLENAPVPVKPPQPKYRPVAAREPVSVAMQDVAPSLPHFPKEKTPDTFDLIWRKVTEWATESWITVRSIAGRVWIQIKSLNRPAPPKERPLIDLSSAEVLKSKRAAAPMRAPVVNPTMLIYLILGAFLFVAIFVIIGIAMTR